jgi:hypothetical protein
MKWASISKKSRQEIYELWDAEEKLLTLTFHADSGSLRITADNEKRVFLVGREGLLRSRTVLRNEYGIRMAQLNYENTHDSIGTIDFDNERFTYAIQKHFLSELTIYKKGESLITCELPPVQEKGSSQQDHDFLILTLCWYVFSLVKKDAEEYA